MSDISFSATAVALAAQIKKENPSQRLALVISKHLRWNLIDVDFLTSHFNEVITAYPICLICLVQVDLNWLRMHSSLTTRVIIAYHFSIVATLLSTTRLTVTHFFRSTLSTGQKRASSTIRFLSRYSVLTERSLLKTPSRTF